MSKDESAGQITFHLERLAEIDSMILRLLKRARSTEELIYAVLKELNVQDNLAQYWLSVTTIKGHLSGLVSTYKVAYRHYRSPSVLEGERMSAATLLKRRVGSRARFSNLFRGCILPCKNRHDARRGRNDGR